MPNKQPYLANQLHTIATEMEQTEVGRASGQTFHTSSGQFNTDVLTKALRDSGWKLFKQWYQDSDKDLDVEIQPLFDPQKNLGNVYGFFIRNWAQILENLRNC